MLIQIRQEQSDLSPHCLSLYLTLLNDVGKNLQQMEFSGDDFACVLRVSRG